MSDLRKICIKLGELQDSASGEVFFRDFLEALDFPSATWNNRVVPHINLLNEGLRIKNKVILIESIGITEQEALEKIESFSPEREEMIILKSSSLLFIKDFQTNIVKIIPISELGKEISFLFPLLNVPRIHTSKKSKVDVTLIPVICELYSILCRDNPEVTALEMRDFLLSLLLCCFLNSTEVFDDSIYKCILMNNNDRGVLFNFLIGSVFDKIKNNCNKIDIVGIEQISTISKDLPLYLPSDISISASNRNKILNLFNYDWKDVEHDFLGMVYQCGLGEPISNRKRTTFFYDDVMRLLNPLFLSQIKAEASNLEDEEQAKSLLNRISEIKILDPCCGSGSFLVYAYKELSSILASIQLRFGLHSNCLPCLNFCGLDKSDFSCEITRLSFFFSMIQNHHGEVNIDALLTASNVFSSKLANRIETLEEDWSDYIECTPSTYVISCPQFIGSSQQSNEEKKEFQSVCCNLSNFRELDYCVAYIVKAAQYTRANNNRFGYLVTSSLSVGEQLRWFSDFLAQLKLYLCFGHSRFSITSEGQNSSSASVVIYGFSHVQPQQACLYERGNKKWLLQELTPSLSKHTTLNVKSRRIPLSEGFPIMKKGNMPYSNDLNKFTTSGKQEMIDKEPLFTQYFRKLIGSKELSNGSFYWCLWFTDVNIAQIKSSPIFLQWCDRVREERALMKQCPARLLEKPYLMREVNETTTYSFALNAVFSENRVRVPIEVIPRNVVVTNLAFVIYDCKQPWVYAILLSHMHMLWVKTYCGKRETRIRYSNELGYNTFPFPSIPYSKRESLRIAGMRILEIREKYLTTSISELWSDDSMPEDLKAALADLDILVESCYHPHPFSSDEERLSVMNSLYLKLIADNEELS